VPKRSVKGKRLRACGGAVLLASLVTKQIGKLYNVISASRCRALFVTTLK
jgi:hypothetical protein